MKNVFIVILLLVFSGCATIPSYRESQNGKAAVEKFIFDLQNKNYEESYSLFSEKLKGITPLKRHVQFMQFLDNEFGGIVNYKVLKTQLPLTLVDENIFKDPYQDERSVAWAYEIKYEKESLVVAIETMRNNGEYQISGFSCQFNEIHNNSAFKRKLEQLNLSEARFSE